MINIYTYETKIGYITLYEEFGLLTRLEFGRITPDESKNEKINETLILKDAKNQLNEYLNKKRKYFDIKLNPKGTGFQKNVWYELLQIPYGETRSYWDIAQNIKSPNSARACGLANNKNPIRIFIPCHRVIGKNGKLTGYRGGLYLKQFLIQLEK